MKKRKIFLGLSMSCLLIGNIFAQQFKGKEEVVVPSGTDGGVEAVYKAQENPITPPKQEPDASTPISAIEQLQNFMKSKKFNEGWDDKKGRCFAIGEASFDCESPAMDPDFLVKREMKVKEAILRAKIAIIESINTNMSASELLHVPGSPLREKFDAKVKAAEKTLNLMKRRLNKLKDYLDASEAEMLKGITWDDRGKALMDAIIKKIDEKFDSKKIVAAKRAKYEKNKQAYEKAKSEMANLEKEAEAIRGELQSEMSSSVSKMAKMPLFGATAIAQAESWNEDDERYEVAVLVCWSNTLQRAARAIATGEDFKITKKKKRKGSVNEWLDKQDLAVMSGPRQYLDADGKRWFLGISARALPKASSQRRKAKSLTEMFASQMAVFCVYSDLASKKTAEQMMQTRNAGKMDSTQVAESMSEKLSQQFKNKTVRGLAKLMSKELIHPISGEKIYVSVYGINPSFAKMAQAVEATNYATAVQSNKYQSEEKGRKAGLEAAVKESENDKASYNKGYTGGKKDVSDEIAKRNAEKAAKLKKAAAKARKKKEEANRQSQEGVFSGDTDVDDDF